MGLIAKSLNLRSVLVPILVILVVFGFLVAGIWLIESNRHPGILEDRLFTLQLDALEAGERSVVLYQSTDTDAKLDRLKQADALEILILDECDVTADGLRHLGSLPNLKTLVIANSPVGDRGAMNLPRCRRIENLALVNASLGEAGVRAFEDIPKLRCLVFFQNFSFGRPETAERVAHALGNLAGLNALAVGGFFFRGTGPVDRSAPWIDERRHHVLEQAMPHTTIVRLGDVPATDLESMAALLLFGSDEQAAPRKLHDRTSLDDPNEEGTNHEKQK
jgi:hypothetical protein